MSLAALANQVVANINLNLQPFPTNKSTLDTKDFNDFDASKMFFRKACGVNPQVHTQKFKRKFSQILGKDLQVVFNGARLQPQSKNMQDWTKYQRYFMYV